MMAFILVALLVAQSDAQSSQNGESLERAFISGGRVQLKLSSGDYKVRAGSDDRIVVRWMGRDALDIDKHVKITISPTTATVKTDGPLRDTKFIVEVPARSDLHLEMRAGDLTVRGIEGNKDIHMTAGDLDIDVDLANYSAVHASVTIGDLDARAIRISKSGFKRSFDWQGNGTYYLRATLFAGDITIR